MDLLAARGDIKNKDLRADSITKKYSHKQLGMSQLLGANLNTKSQKEFKPLTLEHNYRSYSVSILPGTTKNANNYAS